MVIGQSKVVAKGVTRRLEHPAAALALALRSQLDGLHRGDVHSLVRAERAVLLADRYQAALRLRYPRLPSLRLKLSEDPVSALTARLDWALRALDVPIADAVDDAEARCRIDDDELERIIEELALLSKIQSLSVTRARIEEERRRTAAATAADELTAGAPNVGASDGAGKLDDANAGSSSATAGDQVPVLAAGAQVGVPSARPGMDDARGGAVFDDENSQLSATTSSNPASIPGPLSYKRRRQVAGKPPLPTGPKLMKVDAAISLLNTPGRTWTVAELARHVGCAKQTLHGSKRFMCAWNALKASACITRGFKHDDRVEAVDEQDLTAEGES